MKLFHIIINKYPIYILWNWTHILSLHRKWFSLSYILSCYRMQKLLPHLLSEVFRLALLQLWQNRVHFNKDITFFTVQSWYWMFVRKPAIRAQSVFRRESALNSRWPDGYHPEVTVQEIMNKIQHKEYWLF